MQNTFRMAVACICMLVLLNGQRMDGQEAVEREASKEKVEQLRELANPGPEHEELEKYAGKWQVKVTMGNGEQAPASTGNGTSYMTLERRFLWIGYNVNGKAGRIKGNFTIGFDRRNERYSLIAMDTFGTYFVTSHGKKDEKTGKLKLYGKDDDPYMKSLGYDKEFVHVIDLQSDDEFTIEVHFIDTRTPERKEIKAMAFHFTR